MKYIKEFSKVNQVELTKLLRTIPTHDADFKQIQYDKSKKRLSVILYNYINDVEINLIFDGVQFFLSTDLDIWGTNQTISIFSIEENEEFIQSFLEKNHLTIVNQFYFVFESFSGNQMHIVSSKISIEIKGTVL